MEAILIVVVINCYSILTQVTLLLSYQMEKYGYNLFSKDLRIFSSTMLYWQAGLRVVFGYCGGNCHGSRLCELSDTAYDAVIERVVFI